MVRIQVVVLVLFTLVLTRYAQGTCLFSSTGETLTDCQWSRWCWECSSCGQPGNSGTVMLIKGTCCTAPNADPGDCATHCGIRSTTDFNMSAFSTCAASCLDRSDPSVCRTFASGSGTTTAAPTAKISSSTTATKSSTPSSTGSTNGSMTTGSSIASSQSSSSGGSIGPIAGGAAGGVLLIAVIVAVLIYMLQCRKSDVKVDVEKETSIDGKPYTDENCVSA